MALLLAIIIVFSLVAVLIVYELWWKEKLKRRWIQITLSVIFAAILSPAIFHILVSQSNRAQEQAELQFREAVIKALYSQKIEYKELEQLLKLKYKEVFASTEKKAEQWAGEFLNSLPKRRVEEAKIRKQAKRLVDVLEFRWNPLYQFLLKSFDMRAEELTKASAGNLLHSKDIPLVSSNQVNQTQATLRRFGFPNGNELSVEVHTAVVDNGKVTWYPNVIFSERIKESQTTVFVVTFRKDYYELHAGHPRHEGHFEELKTHGNPLEDAQFRTMVNKAFNHAFESGFL